MTTPRFLYGISGYPLAQTMSPHFHNWGFHRINFPAVYMAWPQSPEDLPAFIAAVRTLPISGISLTIPHKEKVIPFLDALTPAATSIKAVNTLFWQDGKLYGDNTDLEGFLHPLRTRTRAAQALVLGAGGAARAVLAGLVELGIPHVAIAARNIDQRTSLAQEFSCTAIPWEERGNFFKTPGNHSPEQGPIWVINTTPIGMAGKSPNESPFPASAWENALPTVATPNHNLAYDLVYNPLQTCFLRDAARAGWETQDGLDMFVAQAVAQFRIWTGHQLPFPEARQTVRDALGHTS